MKNSDFFYLITCMVLIVLFMVSSIVTDVSLSRRIIDLESRYEQAR